MKKFLVVLTALILAMPVCLLAQEEAAKPLSQAEAPAASQKTFSVYTDKRSPDNHYIPSGWMGDYGDVKLNDQYMKEPHSGTTSIQFVYTAKKSQGQGWTGVYWQNPANNWGKRKGGFNLTGAKKLSFWAKGDKGGERIEEFKIGGISGDYPDSDSAIIGPVILSDEWQEYTFDLRGKDLSYINGGFSWATNVDVNPDGCVFYLDQIIYQ